MLWRPSARPLQGNKMRVQLTTKSMKRAMESIDGLKHPRWFSSSQAGGLGYLRVGNVTQRGRWCFRRRFEKYGTTQQAVQAFAAKSFGPKTTQPLLYLQRQTMSRTIPGEATPGGLKHLCFP